MKKVLMIAYHYPPCMGASGIERTLRFSQYLPESGWQPLVLTISPRAYEQISDDQLCEIPRDIIVKRAFGLDSSRHLSVKRHYFMRTALPDRWTTWRWGAVPMGLGLILRYRPDVIWSTYPIATAHTIGATLHRLSKIPWVADFRDSMTEKNYPRDPVVRKAYLRIEKTTIENCCRAVFTTPGALRMYAQRYPDIPDGHWKVVSNGYDKDEFMRVERDIGGKKAPGKPALLVHSGLIYPDERNPRNFFSALADLRRSGKISPVDTKIVLRGSGNELEFERVIKREKIDDIVFFEPPVSHQYALREMLTADGLLIFQGKSCNHQIPAKIYEYLRAKRPIFAMTDSDGDTAHLLADNGINTTASLDSKEEIMLGFMDFLKMIQGGTAPVAREIDMLKYDRKAKALEFSNILDEAAAC